MFGNIAQVGYNYKILSNISQMKLYIKDIIGDGQKLNFELGEELLRTCLPDPGEMGFRLEDPVRGWVWVSRSTPCSCCGST